MIIGGDFNCVLNPAGTTGTFQTSRSLSKIVTRLALIDTWTQDPLRPTYTHHQQHRSYTNRPPLCIPRLGAEKIRKKIIHAAITDHHAVVLRVTIQDQTIRRGL